MNPTGEEIWGPGDWWLRRNEKKVTKQAAHKVQIVELSEKIYKVQIVEPVKPCDHFGWGVGITYVIGVLSVKIIWGSWFFGIVWPLLAPFKVYFHFYPITWF